jgi:hypothetical protein
MAFVGILDVASILRSLVLDIIVSKLRENQLIHQYMNALTCFPMLVNMTIR